VTDRKQFIFPILFCRLTLALEFLKTAAAHYKLCCGLEKKWKRKKSCAWPTAKEARNDWRYWSAGVRGRVKRPSVQSTKKRKKPYVTMHWSKVLPGFEEKFTVSADNECIWDMARATYPGPLLVFERKQKTFAWYRHPVSRVGNGKFSTLIRLDSFIKVFMTRT